LTRSLVRRMLAAVTATEGKLERVSAGSDWAGAALRGLGILASCIVLFVLFPNWLVGYLALRVTPTGRDLILSGWFGVAFVLGCVVFVLLQPRGKE
jgi:hypothetical protein